MDDGMGNFTGRSLIANDEHTGEKLESISIAPSVTTIKSDHLEEDFESMTVAPSAVEFIHFVKEKSETTPIRPSWTENSNQDTNTSHNWMERSDHWCVSSSPHCVISSLDMEETAATASPSTAPVRPRLTVNKLISSLVETSFPTTVRPRLAVSKHSLNTCKPVSRHYPPWQAISSPAQDIDRYRLIVLSEPLRHLLSRPSLEVVLPQLHELRDIARKAILSLSKRAAAGERSRLAAIASSTPLAKVKNPDNRWLTGPLATDPRPVAGDLTRFVIFPNFQSG